MNVKEQIDAALIEVTEAENALERVLADLTAGPRAEKVSVSEVVAEAFTRLRAGRLALSKLREALARDSSSDG